MANLNLKIPTKDQLKQGGLIALLSVILSTVLTFAIDWRQEGRIDYQELLQRQAKNIDKLEARVDALVIENQKLQEQVNILNSVTYEMPVPMWIKSLEGKMINLNNAYEQMFLKPNGLDRFDYIGKDDIELWSVLGQAEQGAKYRAHDLEVITTRQTKRYIEEVLINNKHMKVIVYKYPYWSASPNWNGRQVIGVGGLAIPVDWD
jgi:hypothetical protein